MGMERDMTDRQVAAAFGRLPAPVNGNAALMRSWCFATRASAEAWSRFWEPVPRPFYHDLLVMTRFGTARFEGDLQPLMANLRYVKEGLEAPRGRIGGRDHGA